MFIAIINKLRGKITPLRNKPTKSNNKMKQIPLSFKLVIILVWALPQMSTDIYLPSMPAMASYFHTSISMIQYTIFFFIPSDLA